MNIKNKQSATRIAIDCRSNVLFRNNMNRVVVLVDDVIAPSFQKKIHNITLTESEGRDSSHLPVISYYWNSKGPVLLSQFLFGMKRIKRIDPLPDQNRSTYIFDERLSNFSLSEATKQMLLDTNPPLRTGIMKDMTNFGELLESVGLNRLKKYVNNMAAQYGE